MIPLAPSSSSSPCSSHLCSLLGALLLWPEKGRPDKGAKQEALGPCSELHRLHRSDGSPPCPCSSGNRQQPETERLEPGVGDWCPHAPLPLRLVFSPHPAPASAGAAIRTCSLDLPFFPYWPPGYPNALRTNSIQISVPFNLLILGFID